MGDVKTDTIDTEEKHEPPPGATGGRFIEGFVVGVTVGVALGMSVAMLLM